MLALTVALVGPYFVDWTSYRADFEREAGRILGREVKVGGTANARLLPFPSLTFTDVVVAGVEPGEPAVTVETFSMDAELAPFMRGDVHIFDMRLVRPSILVDVAEDGALDWAVRPSVPVEARHISLEKLTVTEGRVVIRHAASGRTHTLTEVNADISARSLAGPWRMDGSLRVDGMRTALSVSTGAVLPGEGMRLRVRAQPERYPFALEADGTALIEDGRPHYAGSFRLTGGPQVEPREGRTTAPAYRLNGTFDFDHALVDIGEFRFETGPIDDPYIAEGAAEFALGVEPSFAIRADGAQIRIDERAEQTGEGAALGDRLTAFREFLLDVPRPAIPGRIEVALPAVVAGDTTVRDVRLSAEPSETGWTIASLGATLPGRTTLEAQGDLVVAEELGFTGSMLLAVGQPSGFAAWVARDVDDAIRRLPAAGFSAQVELSERQQTFRDLELILGAARFTGDIESRTPEDEKPSMRLRLDGDRLDVEGMAAFASLFVSERGEARLADRDLEFEIVAGPVAAAGLTAETIDTALRYKDGRLEIDRFAIGGLAGANVSATGTVSGMGDRPSGTMDVSIISADLAPLVSTLAARFPENLPAQALARRVDAYPGLLENARLHATANTAAQPGGSATLGLNLTGEAGGTSLTLALSSEDLAAGPFAAPLTLELTAANDEAATLYALAGLPALPLGLAGAAQLRLSFDGTVEDGGWTRFGFSGEGLDLTFEGAAGLEQDMVSANGVAEVESEDLEPWLAAAGIPAPGFGLGLPVRLSAEFDMDGGLVMLSNLSGEIAGSSVAGDVNAQLREGVPHLTGGLSVAALDLATVAEVVAGPDALSAADGGWPSAPFAPAVSTPMTTDLDLTVEELRAGFGSPMRDARLALRLGRDGVSISNLTAAMFGGSLAGILDFRNDGGTGLLSGQLRLSGADARQLLGETGLSGAVDLTASVTASGKSVDGVVSALAGSGTASLRDLALEGMDPHALPALLGLADGFGPQIDAAATASFANDRVREGLFEADRVDVAFTIASGAVRAPPLRLETPEAMLSADLRADLRAGTVGVDALLTYEAGVEALAGSEPAVRFVAAGPLDDIAVDVDTAPLAQFLAQRALEAEQQRVEAMQAGLLERQRHRRELRYYAALVEERQSAAEELRRGEQEADRLERMLRQSGEEAERRRRDEQTRLDAEEAARHAAAEVERERQRLAEEARQAEERRQEEARRREDDERLRAEVEALLQARDAAQVPVPELDTPDAVLRMPIEPPAVVGVTPTPRPSAEAAPAASGAAAESQTPQPFARDGFMRLLFGD